MERIYLNERSKYAEDVEGQLLTDSQDLEAVLEHVTDEMIARTGIRDRTTVTGAIVKVGEGEYVSIWLTDTSQPWHPLSNYEQIL